MAGGVVFKEPGNINKRMVNEQFLFCPFTYPPKSKAAFSNYNFFFLSHLTFKCMYVRAGVCVYFCFGERVIERWAFAGDDVSFSILYRRMMSVKKCRVFLLLLL